MGTYHVIPKETKEQVLHRIKNDGITAAQAARDAGISGRYSVWLVSENSTGE